MTNYSHIVISKNRGWRGLAEAKFYIKLGDAPELTRKMLFTFSSKMWEQLYKGYFCYMEGTDFIIIPIGTGGLRQLPKTKDGEMPQRSVLLNDIVINEIAYNKAMVLTAPPTSSAITDELYKTAYAFNKNRNNVTKSIWNNVGLRVSPKI